MSKNNLNSRISQVCTTENPFYYNFGLANWRRIIYANSVFLTLRKFGKPKQLTKHPSVIFLLSELWMCCVPLTWQEQENLGARSSSCSLARSTIIFASIPVVSRIVIVICSLVLQILSVHRTHNSAIYKSTS